MKVGLIGPPQSGKSTLFAAITGQRIDSSLAHQEHTASIKVPDERLDYIGELFKPRRITHAHIELHDFPGISSRDDHGKQQYDRHVPHIRLCEVLVAVVRDFANDAVAALNERIDPAVDLTDLKDDFIVADLEAVMARIGRLETALKKPTRSHEQEKKELALLQRCRQALEEVKPLSSVLEHADEVHMLRSFAFLTEKPLLVVVNVGEDKAVSEAILEYEHAHSVINVCADAEAQIAELEGQADRAAFLQDLGITEPARERLIQNCYAAAGLISFLTCNAEEARAWAIHRGASAVEAAGKVHTDMARGFIRAETVHYDELKAAGGDLKTVKGAGKLRQEGKTYTVQDGDLINFKFNV